MTAANIHIVNLYEQGLTPEQIAQAEGFGLTAVKAVLYGASAKYRESIGETKTLDFKDDELEQANQVLQRLMHSDDDHLAFKAARYIRDDKKGRLDAKAGLKGLKGLNITLINQQLMAAANAVLPKSPSPSKQIMDVEATTA